MRESSLTERAPHRDCTASILNFAEPYVAFSTVRISATLCISLRDEKVADQNTARS